MKKCGHVDLCLTTTCVCLGICHTFTLIYVIVPNSILNPKFGFFARYGSGKFGYRFWDGNVKKIIYSKDVIFNEQVLYKDNKVSLVDESQIEEDSIIDRYVFLVELEENVEKLVKNDNMK